MLFMIMRVQIKMALEAFLRMLNGIIFFSIVLLLMHAVRLLMIFFIMLLSYMYRLVTDRAPILSLKVSSIHDMLKNL